MLRTPAGVDVPAASGGDYTANLLFDTPADAKFLRVGDTVEDRVGVQFSVLYWSTFPSDFSSGGQIVVAGSTTPTQSLTTDDAVVFTPGQLDVRPRVQTDGSIITVTAGSGQLYEYEITATWTISAEGNAATTGDHVIDSTGKAYEITRITVPGPSQWASGVFVTELENEGETPDTGTAYLYSPTPNFDMYQGKFLNQIAEDTRRNRDEFTTDVVISGINTDITNIETDLTNIATELGLVISSGEELVTHDDLAASGFITQSDLDANDFTTQADILASGFVSQDELAASGFTTQDDIAASGFVGTHTLLSSEHTDTIAQAAVSGGIVTALDGAWGQLSPGIEGSLLSIEGGLPNYTDEITVSSGGNINIGGDIVASGSLTVIGDFNGTPDLSASGFTTQDDIAASGFVGTHSLLSSEHTDTIAQAAVSGAIVSALDGAWSQLTPGIEGSLLSIEDGLPNYTDEITVSSGGNINIGGDVITSGSLTVIGDFNGTPDLSASGFTTQDDIAASGFVGTHTLLSSEHTDTITQAAISGGIVAALDGAWSQLPPGLEGSTIFVEGGLPAYNSNITLLPDGSVNIGGNTLISGDLSVLGNLDGTPDLTASGFVVGPASAGDSTVALFDGTTGELIKELPNDANGLVLTIVSGSPAWAPASGGGGGGGDLTGPGSSTDNAVMRWDGTTGTVAQDSLIIVDDSGIINLPAGVTQAVTQGSGTATVNVQNSDWLVRVDTQGQAVTVNLPPAPVNGQIHTIKDGNGNAAINNITVTVGAGQLIDPSASTLVMNLAYQSVELMWVADPGVWHII